MKNGLVKRIGMKLILPLAIAGIVGGGCKTYVVDGNKVKKNPTIFNYLVENKGDTLEIKYTSHVASSDLKKIKINGEKYTSNDRDVFLKALNHYWYLIDEIDSIKSGNNPRAREKIDYGIKAFE